MAFNFSDTTTERLLEELDQLEEHVEDGGEGDADAEAEIAAIKEELDKRNYVG